VKRDVHFRVAGRVQGVMFRQTLIRAAQKRRIEAAASNLADGTVSCFLSGLSTGVDEILDGLRAGKEINSWGARVAELVLLAENEGIPFDEHQVTTANVDRFSWSSGVDMYL
jgi:acylphosphatase